MATAPGPRTITRDPEELAHRLTAWLGARLSGAKAVGVTVPASNGLSSETLLFDIQNPEPPLRSCALRLPADPSAYTVFPVYDMVRQFRTMEVVGRLSDLPVPKAQWLEEDPARSGHRSSSWSACGGAYRRMSCPTPTRATGCTPRATPNANTSRPPRSGCWHAFTTKSRCGKRSSWSCPARATRCAAMSPPNARTATGWWTDSTAHPSSSRPSTGWSSSGRPTRGHPSSTGATRPRRARRRSGRPWCRRCRRR
ncbi:hypothetical protein QFZ22_008201 [Streptomyces canus]|uniref:Aminoglycoside phosphotransferase domain-containing protein n=1 Tax=Streptomyces canus TaxID=58343 RepID=A0AAW8FQ40_9ACTN|nr:hypothetical protein [Streptomyces canus]